MEIEEKKNHSDGHYRRAMSVLKSVSLVLHESMNCSHLQWYTSVLDSALMPSDLPDEKTAASRKATVDPDLLSESGQASCHHSPLQLLLLSSSCTSTLTFFCHWARPRRSQQLWRCTRPQQHLSMIFMDRQQRPIRVRWKNGVLLSIEGEEEKGRTRVPL